MPMTAYRRPVATNPALLHVIGMSGMGDNIHERALIRRWAQQGKRVWLETPWPILFRDLPVECIRRPERLRTQARNAEREAAAFSKVPRPPGARQIRLSYNGADIRRTGSVLGAMAASAGEAMGLDLDFRMDAPMSWRAQAAALLDERISLADKPIMIYRPLVERREWGGCRNRNPDLDAYRDLFESIRDRYSVISIADLEPKVEWITSHAVQADQEFHAGELEMEAMIGLFAMANLVFASPGFAVLLGQAVGTPTVCTFGGYETQESFAAGARFTPTLALGPGCGCFSHVHRCRKDFDVQDAIHQLKRFI